MKINKKDIYDYQNQGVVLLKNIIFGNNHTTGLIKDNYFFYSNVNNQFELLIKNLNKLGSNLKK